MKKINFKELKETINNFQGKNVMLKITGLIGTDINVKKANVTIIENEFIIRVNEEISISIDTNWVANFYTNDDNTIVKLEFDNLGEVILAINK